MVSLCILLRSVLDTWAARLLWLYVRAVRVVEDENVEKEERSRRQKKHICTYILYTDAQCSYVYLSRIQRDTTMFAKFSILFELNCRIDKIKLNRESSFLPIYKQLRASFVLYLSIKIKLLFDAFHYSKLISY